MALKKTYKTRIAIFGGGLSGLVAAARLARAGQDFILFESFQEFGGCIRPHDEQGVPLDYGLKSVPVGTDLQGNPLVKLKTELALDFQIESWKEHALAWRKNNWTEFVGFGEAKEKETIRQLEYYMASPRLMVAGGWRNLMQGLLAVIPEDKRIAQAHVTSLNIEGEVVNGAILNGESILKAEKYIFAGPPAELTPLLPSDSKAAEKIARTELLTAINIDLATKSRFSDLKNTLLLEDEDHFFVVGQFISNADPVRKSMGLQISSWMSLFDSEFAQNDENASKAIRMMKRLIKKAFPLLTEQASWERILVVPRALGTYQHLTYEKNGALVGFKNLWACGGQYPSAGRNTGAAIESASLIARKIADDQIAPNPSATSEKTIDVL